MGRFLDFVRRGRGLPAYAGVVLGWMILVILWGAVVRATGSGAGCGDRWPLCNGDFFPQHPRLATVIEYTHRSMSGICTVSVAALVAWTFAAQPKGSRVRKAAVWSGLLLVTEALLGAVLVLGGYVEHNASDTRVLVQCVHFTNTMLLLGALTLAWWWQRPRTPLGGGAGGTARLAWLALAATVLTGATGSVAALADTLFPAISLRSALAADLASTSPLLIRMRWMHPAASALAFLAIAGMAWKVQGRRGKALIALLAAQLVLGVGDVLALAPVWLQVLHLFGADLLWVAVVATAADVLQRAPSSDPIATSPGTLAQNFAVRGA